MSKALLFSLVLLFATFLSAFAGDTTGTTDAATERKFSLTLGGMYGFMLNGTSLRAAHAPGLTAVLDYSLSSRSSLLLSWANQKIDYGSYQVTDNLISLGYKYWLTDSKAWRPWVQAGAGYVWERYEEEWLGAHYRYSTGDFQLNFGGGIRHELTENVGLDASVLLYKSGAPWNWSDRSKLITTSLGADVKF